MNDQPDQQGTLARDGGKPVRTAPFPTVNDAAGRTWGEDERALILEVLESGKLNHTVTTDGKVHQFERLFADWIGLKHVVASTSGTSALHLAVAGINPNPGDEIIVPPISDFGSVIPILSQNAVPVFADVDPLTWCIDADAIEAQITDRTRAIMVVHLFGQACDMDRIMDVANRHGIPVIEDCCQAYGATWNGQHVGTFGEIACFSLQQSKHISTGDGGLTATNNADLGRRMRLFADKAWPRDTNTREHRFLGLNYRMTELQGAIGVGQMSKLDSVIASRKHAGDGLRERIADWPGIRAIGALLPSASSYWLFPITIDSDEIGRASDIAAALRDEGIPASSGYVRPMYMNAALAEGETYGTSHFPFDSPYTTRRYQDYREGLCPVAESMAEHTVILPINERFTEDDVRDLADGVNKVFGAFASAREQE